MNEKIFWEIISFFNWDMVGDDQAVIEPAVSELASKLESEIIEFEELLATKLHLLDTEAHAMEIGEDSYKGEDQHFSVDWFLYARCVVIANGKELYEEVLNQPKEFPKDVEFEALLSVAPLAFERKTGAEFNHRTKLSYETFSNSKGWK